MSRRGSGLGAGLVIALLQGACSLVGLDALSGGDPTASAGPGGGQGGQGEGASGAGAPATTGETVTTSGSTGRGAGGGGGDGTGGGGCVPPSYGDVVSASGPLVHFRFEETEGDVALAEDGVTAGTYQQATGGPGSGAPIELGVPGLAGGGRAVRLPPSEAALVLPLSVLSYVGNNFDPRPHTIEVWLGVQPTFRGTVLQQAWGGAVSPATLALSVDPPTTAGPEIGFHVDPHANGNASATAIPESIARVHVAVVVTRVPGPTPCKSPEQIVVHVDGEPGEPAIVCGYGAIVEDGSGPMNLPGASAAMPVTPLVMDELAIYDRALTPEEILAHAEAGRACED